MRIQSFKFVAALLVLIVVPLATAGAPLICFPYEIGNAKSLPWVANAGFGAPRSDYDTRLLTDETIALLGESTPVIVRMETIRRAVLYTAKDDRIRVQLIERMRARSLTGSGRALALFDYGYLLETMKQAAGEGIKSTPAATEPGGYSYILQALQARGNDPEMEFAAAKVSAWPNLAGYDDHLRKAAAGADNDPLLAANLRSHFPALNFSSARHSKNADSGARRK